MMPRLSAETPVIHADCEIADSRFGRYVEIRRGRRLAHTVIDDYSDCDRVANIAAFSRIGATDHPLHTAACRDFLYRSDDYWDDATRDAAFFAHRQSRCATIGHDTWIGAGAMLKPEVTLGHGAVVAAGAIVTRDVAPYSIQAGNLARPLTARQPRAVADRLIALAWWDWDHEALRAALEDFRQLSAEAFLEKHGGQAGNPSVPAQSVIHPRKTTGQAGAGTPITRWRRDEMTTRAETVMRNP